MRNLMKKHREGDKMELCTNGLHSKNMLKKGGFPAVTDKKYVQDNKRNNSISSCDSVYNTNRHSYSQPAVSLGLMSLPKGSRQSVGMGVRRISRGSNKFANLGMMRAETNPFDLVSDMPKEPRFSTALSPEAQYSIMKGYEDLLIEYLNQSKPEYCSLIRRTHTPTQVLGVRGQKHTSYGSVCDTLCFSEEEEIESVSQLNSEMNYRPVWNKAAVSISRQSSCLGSTSATSILQPDQQLTDVDSCKQNKHALVSEKRLADVSTGLEKTSLPAIPKHQQLVLSHRLQNAMDILDTLKGKMGMQVISPRISSCQREIKPLRDFNTWASVWVHEFNVRTKS